MPTIHRFSVRILALATLIVSGSLPCAAATPQVHIEVVGASAVAAHEWGRALAKAPFASVKIVSGQDSIPSVEVEGSEGSRVYRVRGVISDRNQLRLPRHRFGINDTEGLKDWINSLNEVRDVRPTGTKPTPRMAFGMSAAELVRVTDLLKVTVGTETKGRPVRKVMSEINRLVGRRIVMDPPARAAIPADLMVEDELSGLSAGVALAALVRPAGLVVVPLPDGGSTRLLVRDFRDTEEHWPIGWPAEGPPRDHVPKLYESLEVEIADTSLRDTIGALQARLEVPVLYDQNGMARQRINLDEVTASFPPKRTLYTRILKTVLSQGKLKYELRVDEAERPFLWISPSRSR